MPTTTQTAHHTTCTTCGAIHDSGMDETVTECPACPSPAPSSLASDLADIAADRLTRLAEDLARDGSVPGCNPVAHEAIGRTIADDRNEAAGAIRRAYAADPLSVRKRVAFIEAGAMGQREGRKQVLDALAEWVRASRVCTAPPSALLHDLDAWATAQGKAEPARGCCGEHETGSGEHGDECPAVAGAS